MSRCLGGVHQRSRRRPERAALREADELVAGVGQSQSSGTAARGPELGRQQRAQQAQRELAGGDAFLALGVLVDDGVDAAAVVDDCASCRR